MDSVILLFIVAGASAVSLPLFIKITEKEDRKSALYSLRILSITGAAVFNAIPAVLILAGSSETAADITRFIGSLFLVLGSFVIIAEKKAKAKKENKKDYTFIYHLVIAIALLALAITNMVI